jgi:hypothetical protein
MKKSILLSYFICLLSLFATIDVVGNVLLNPPDTLIANFYLPENACVQQQVTIEYTGNAPQNATYIWDFGGAVIISGSGQGPYKVKWETVGLKSVSLTVHWGSLVADTTKQIHIQPHPEMFHMTGGGSYPAGGNGVEVGLSGSQVNVLYKLRRGAEYTGINVSGTGSPISFGLQTIPGSYNAVAYSTACLWEMEGTAVVEVINPPHPFICMVTFDTLALKNKVIWNKTETTLISQVNIYKETYQNEIYEKIAEVPYANPGIYLDTNSFPLVRSYKYRISFVDTNNHQSDKSPYHKTIHLNIDAGIYGFNLIWNHYAGFEFLTYNIYRKIGTDPYVKIASVASNIDSYTDFYVTSGVVTYYIEVVRPEPCHPEFKSGDYSTIVSNIAAAAPLGIEQNQQTGVIVYPNPAKDKVFIVMDSRVIKSFRIELFQPNGQILFSKESMESRSEIDLSSLSSGVYFIRISTENSITVKKIIKE